MKEMTEEEVLDAIDGLMSYDTGCTDSGIHDELLRARVIAWLKPVGDKDGKRAMTLLSKYAADLLTNGAGYTLEDVKGLIDWLSDRMDYDV